MHVVWRFIQSPPTADLMQACSSDLPSKWVVPMRILRHLSHLAVAYDDIPIMINITRGWWQLP